MLQQQMDVEGVLKHLKAVVSAVGEPSTSASAPAKNQPLRSCSPQPKALSRDVAYPGCFNDLGYASFAASDFDLSPGQMLNWSSSPFVAGAAAAPQVAPPAPFPGASRVSKVTEPAKVRLGASAAAKPAVRAGAVGAAASRPAASSRAAANASASTARPGSSPLAGGNSPATAELLLTVQQLTSRLASNELRVSSHVETIRTLQQALALRDQALAELRGAAAAASSVAQQKVQGQKESGGSGGRVPAAAAAAAAEAHQDCCGTGASVPAAPAAAAASGWSVEATAEVVIRAKELERALVRSRQGEEKARERIAVLLDSLKAASRDKAALAREVDALRKAGDDKDGSMATARRRLENMQTFLHKEKAAREAAEGCLAEARGQVATLKSQLDSSRGQMAQMQCLLEQAHGQASQQLAALQEAASRQEELQRQLDAVQSRAEGWRLKAYQQAKELAGGEDATRELKTQLRAAEQQVAMLQSTLDKVYAMRQKRGGAAAGGSPLSPVSGASTYDWIRQTKQAEAEAVAQARQARVAAQKLQLKAHQLKRAAATAQREADDDPANSSPSSSSSPLPPPGGLQEDIQSEMRFYAQVVGATREGCEQARRDDEDADSVDQYKLVPWPRFPSSPPVTSSAADSSAPGAAAPRRKGQQSLALATASSSRRNRRAEACTEDDDDDVCDDRTGRRGQHANAEHGGPDDVGRQAASKSLSLVCGAPAGLLRAQYQQLKKTLAITQS